MTCLRLVGGVDGFICTPNAFVNLAPFGAHVWCEYHSYLGPSFYRSENAIQEIATPSRKTWDAFETWLRSCKPLTSPANMQPLPTMD